MAAQAWFSRGDIDVTPGTVAVLQLTVVNLGDATDTLIVTMLQGGAFASQLCRPDGVCAANDLSIVNVGAGNTAYVLLRVSVPGDAYDVRLDNLMLMPTIFADGFETSDTSRWSAAVP